MDGLDAWFSLKNNRESMFIFLFIFIASSVLLFTMIGFRAWELKTGKTTFPSDNTPLFTAFEWKKPMHLLNHEDVAVLYEHVRLHIVELTTSLFLQAKRAPKPRFVQKILDMIRGRNTIIIKREVDSPFFRTIVEHKEKMRENRNAAGNTLSSL